MKHCYKCKTFKLPTEFGKNSSKPDGLATECRVCKRQQDREYAAKNRDTAKHKSSIWYYENKKYVLESRKEYRSSWSKQNRHKRNAVETKRRALKVKATPKWLTAEHFRQIESIYWLAQLQKELTDTQYHVDHIVPLKGKTVCGLHVPWNLQVIPALDNIRKGNRIVL